MLQPPGSSNARRAPGPPSRRSKAPEHPDDLIRQLQRWPPNKKCCDCSSKLPSCVNLNVGCFVCMVCAGIHRELNQRVKGVGHSNFTAEEAEFVKRTDNDKVNAVYLARYNPTIDRMRMPQDNTDQQHVRAWIRRKYQEKVWYSEQPASQQQQQQQNQYDRPTIAQIAPKQQEQAVDLFGGFGGNNNTGGPPPNNNQPWDAFRNQPPQQQQQQHSAPQQTQQAPFQANFANFTPPAPAPPTQHKPQPQNDFPPDFGSSQNRQQIQQPPPPQLQSQQTPNNLAFQANFGNFPSQSSPPPQQQQQFANFPPVQQGGFAPTSNQTSTNQPHLQPQQHRASFNSNFDQNSGPRQQQPPTQQHAFSNQQGSFVANFDQAPGQPPHSLQPPKPFPPPPQQQQGGFVANFDQMSAGQPPPQPSTLQPRDSFSGNFDPAPGQPKPQQPVQNAFPQQQQGQNAFSQQQQAQNAFPQQQQGQNAFPQPQHGGFVANFDQMATGQPQQQQPPTTPHQNPLQQRNSFNATFDQGQPKQQPQEQKTFLQQPQQQQGGFVANFDQMTMGQQQHPSQQRNSFNASFNQAPGQQPQAQSLFPQQQQQGGFNSFDQNAAAQFQQQYKQPPQVQQLETPPQLQGSANLSQQPTNKNQAFPGQQMQSHAPVVQQPGSTQGGFANLMQQQQYQPRQSLQGLSQAPSQEGATPLSQQDGGFANFSVQQKPYSPASVQPPSQQQSIGHQQPQKQQNQQQQGGFADFAHQQQPAQPQQPRQTLAPQQTQQNQTGDFAAFSQQDPQKQGMAQPFMKQGPESHQQHSPPRSNFGFQQGSSLQQLQGGSFDSFSQERQQHPGVQQQSFGDVQANQQSQQPFQMPKQVSESNVSTAAVILPQLNITQQSSKLSISDPVSVGTGAMDTSKKSNASSTLGKTAKVGVSKFKSGQTLYYKSASYMGKAEVVKVHFDHELEPFYTVKVDGKEKQTDDAHLSLKHPTQEKIEDMLSGLAEAQLKAVHDFIADLLRSNDGIPSTKLSFDKSSSVPDANITEASNMGEELQLTNNIQGQNNHDLSTALDPSNQTFTNGLQQLNEGLKSSQQQVMPDSNKQLSSGMWSDVNNSNTEEDPFAGIPSPSQAPTTIVNEEVANSVPAPPFGSHDNQNAQPQDQQPPQKDQQINALSANQAPMSPKGNPFDFY